MFSGAPIGGCGCGGMTTTGGGGGGGVFWAQAARTLITASGASFKKLRENPLVFGRVTGPLRTF
ncbi:proteasome regulatory subunit Rpn10 [Novosphingobium sp. 9U]|nr:proteasome regulatory subunit Rpn10 [Novosphingobium sp. 9U]